MNALLADNREWSNVIVNEYQSENKTSIQQSALSRAN